MDSIYEKLTGIPLFKGVSQSRIFEIVGQCKLHFMKYLEGETIVTAGEACTHITFLISGSARLTVGSRDGRFSVAHTLAAPEVIAPDFLFGRDTRFPCTAVAIEPTGIMKIEKADYIRILDSDKVFLLNFLNTLSRNAQKSVDGILALTEGSLEERIAFWIICLSQPGGTDITLSCRQRDLYSLFGVPRSSLVSTLDSMKERGLIDYTPTMITVTSRRALLDILINHHE